MIYLLRVSLKIRFKEMTVLNMFRYIVGRRALQLEDIDLVYIDIALLYIHDVDSMFCQIVIFC